MIQQEVALTPHYSEQAQNQNTISSSISLFPSAICPNRVTYTTTGSGHCTWHSPPMNTTSFMDHQIMDPTRFSSSSSQQTKDLIDLIKNNSNKNINGGISQNDIIFHPIRPIVNFGGVAFSWPWNSDSNAGSYLPHPIVKGYGSLDTMEPEKAVVEKDPKAFGASILSEIDQTIKKHMENWRHVMEGVSAPLTQLDRRTRRLEKSLDDLKVSFGNSSL